MTPKNHLHQENTLKNPCIAAAVTALCLVGQAAAQSTVTLGGVADIAARQVSNEGRGSAKSLVSGSNATSRIFVRASEDLGGGMAAGFHLEHGIQLDTGAAVQATQIWDRRSTVSLAHKSLGEIRAGRDFVPSYSGWSRFDPFTYVGVASSSNFVSASPQGPIRNGFASNPNTTVRSSNALQVLLPGSLGGLEGGVMIAAGEGGTAANGQHKLIGLRLGYVSGPWNASVAHTRSENNLTVTGGAFKDTSLGASYKFGIAQVSLATRRFEQSTAKQTHTLLGAWIPAGSQGEVKFSYHQVNLSGTIGATRIDANDAKQIGVGYVYNLSRRSALYGTLARIDNAGAATYAVPGGPTGLAAGGKSTGAEVGFRHNF
jgi:predicted porin